MKSILLGFTIIMILISCRHQYDNNNREDEDILSKSINFPKGLLELEGTQFKQIDPVKLNKDNMMKVISIVDGICMKCIIYQLNKIDSIFQRALPKENSNIIFVLNVLKEDSSYFMQNLQPAIDADGIILWDNNYHFERTNDLFTSDLNLRTFMVNRENEIIQFGNPVMNPGVIADYKAKIESLSKLE